MMDSESATPIDKASSPSPSKSTSETPAPAPLATAALSDTSESDSDDDEVTPQVEWLATGRERRSTAGNRMKSMLAAEEPDDDLELLFAEDDNDQGFSDGEEDGSDVHMDSSSDDEDNNNATAADDLEGEKELERQAKEKRAAQRKRKAQDAHIPAKFRKKVRINTEAPPPRPKKKSERASWLPSPADLPTRASSRSTTRLSKEQLHTQMVEREARRLKQVAQMQKKAAKLEAMRKPPMTQEERLREAEKVEQRNRGSLNRWEEAEKAREEERLRKLKALTERRLEGPVITFWSGVREGQVKYVEMEEKPVRKKREKPMKTKAAAEQKEAEKGNTPKPDDKTEAGKAEADKAEGGDKTAEQKAENNCLASESASETVTKVEDENTNKEDTSPAKAEIKPLDTSEPKTESTKPLGTEDPENVSAAPCPAPPSEATASKAEAPLEKEKTPAAEEAKEVATKEPQVEASRENESAKPKEQPENATAASTPLTEPSIQDQHPDIASSNTNTGTKAPPVVIAPVLSLPHEAKSTPTASPGFLAESGITRSSPPPAGPVTKDGMLLSLDAIAKEAPSAPQSEQPTPKPELADEGAPAVTEKAPRNAIIFQNFNENVIKDKSIQNQILFGQKMTKLSKPAPSPICVITNRPARYRDPSTGLPFATAHAYHEIRRLIRGDYKWSRLLGAWVGTGTYAARGVPERFLNPDAMSPAKKKEQEEEKKKAEETAAKKESDDLAKPEEGNEPDAAASADAGISAGAVAGAGTGATGGDVTMTEAPAVTA